FREGPALIECFKKVKNKPDVIIFDGHGISHPRGMGIATHMGILLGIPSIGCAKSPLYGKFDMPGKSRGGYTFVRDGGGEVIGACFRSKDGVKPVFVSVGNGINLIRAVDIINGCITKYRLPEPVRIADALSKSEHL
ncbi:MAG: endonuclease V, partial [Candidatus Desulfatibia sp.]|uniref:endonuclease V n=1 Tax=Candidatus Desulfatibia sp. TaxID=3101189 RepID=UPI002F30A33E